MTYLIPQLPASGGVTLNSSWRFSTTTAAADPGNRTLRYDNATPANVLNLYINDTTNEGTDASTILGLLVAGNRIYVQQNDDAANATLFELTGPAVDNTGWWTVPVSVVSTLALPVNNKSCVVIMNLGASATVKTKIMDIGDWDMDALSTLNVAHGLTFSIIRSVAVFIRNDQDALVTNIDRDTGAGSAGYAQWDSTNIVINRVAGSLYDGISYNDGSAYNRGWITIHYV